MTEQKNSDEIKKRFSLPDADSRFFDVSNGGANGVLLNIKKNEQQKTENLRKDIAAKMILHTRQSLQLWEGRRGDKSKGIYAICGLIEFGSQVGKIWLEASLDNPAADFCLVKIEKQFDAARKVIDTRLAEMKELIGNNDFFEEITIASNKQPVEVDLKFSCPWAFHAAGLLKKFDELVCLTLTARHVGFVDSQGWSNIVYDSARVLRKFFSSCENFVYVPLQREWFLDAEKHKKELFDAKTIWKFYGKKLPFIQAEFLNGEKRASLSPPIKNEAGMKIMRAEQFAAARELVIKAHKHRMNSRDKKTIETTKN